MFPSAEVPLFQLSDERGDAWGTRDLWQRRDMLLALVHPEGCEPCHRLLELLRARGAGLHAEEIELVIVSMRGTPHHLDGLRVLPDREGRIARALAEHGGFEPGQARLLAADRFGRLYGTEDIHAGDPESVLVSALDWLEFAQSRCEECGGYLEWK